MGTEEDVAITPQVVREKTEALFKRVYLLKNLRGKKESLDTLKKILETVGMAEGALEALLEELERLEKAVEICLKISR